MGAADGVRVVLVARRLSTSRTSSQAHATLRAPNLEHRLQRVQPVFTLQHRVRHRARVPTQRLQRVPLNRIARSPRRLRMPRRAVYMQCHFSFRPSEVDSHHARNIELPTYRHEPESPQRPPHLHFERRLRVSITSQLEQLREPFEPAAPARMQRLQLHLQPAHQARVLHRCGVQRELQSLFVQLTCEIDERPRDARHTQPVACLERCRYITWRVRMNSEEPYSSWPRHRHIDCFRNALIQRRQTKSVRRAEMRQCSAWPGSQQRRHRPLTPARPRRRRSIHAGVHQEPFSTRDAPFDDTAPETRRKHLLARNHSELTRHQRRQPVHTHACTRGARQLVALQRAMHVRTPPVGFSSSRSEGQARDEHDARQMNPHLPTGKNAPAYWQLPFKHCVLPPHTAHALPLVPHAELLVEVTQVLSG
jgi:hypothetical protein